MPVFATVGSAALKPKASASSPKSSYARHTRHKLDGSRGTPRTLLQTSGCKRRSEGSNGAFHTSLVALHLRGRERLESLAEPCILYLRWEPCNLCPHMHSRPHTDTSIPLCRYRKDMANRALPDGMAALACIREDIRTKQIEEARLNSLGTHDMNL